MERLKIFYASFVLLVFASIISFGCSDNTEINPSESSSSGNSGDSSSSSSNSGDDSSNSGNNSSSSGNLGNSSGSNSSNNSSSSSNSSGNNSSSSNNSGVSSSSIQNVSSSSLTPPQPEQYEKLTSANAQRGWASRYWDGCKPHCSWREQVDTTAVPFTICRNCDRNNNEIAAFTLSPAAIGNQYWTGYEGTKSSCESGGIAFTCFDMAPIAINDTLAYGFAAAPGNEAACGQCFQLQFDGRTHNGDSEIKEAHRLISGKTLIVLASNIGHDVESGQFDILIPGGGVGAYDSFTNLLGVSKDEMGAVYGGFLTTCQQSLNDYNLPAARYKECVRDKCQEIFGRDPKFSDLLRGCNWFVDWYHAADNPSYFYKKVPCPDYLTQKYLSTINTSKDTDLRP